MLNCQQALPLSVLTVFAVYHTHRFLTRLEIEHIANAGENPSPQLNVFQNLETSRAHEVISSISHNEESQKSLT